MEELKGGRDTALNELMSKWQSPLVSYLYRYTSNHEDALDLAQEAFVRVYENRHRYEPRAKFSSWLFTIATNLSSNHARWKQRHPTVSLHSASSEGTLLSLAAGLADAGHSPFDSADHSDRASAVRRQIAALPDDMRKAIILSEYEDLTHHEIGEIMGCTAKATEVRLYRAREMLRRGLASWLRF